MKFTGKVWKYGADIDTDKIIPARYLNTSDPKELAKHCMEDEDATFASKVAPGDIIVADKNFGCGSSREHAPIALKACGVACIIAKSFARIFYRNSFNMGLSILESDEVFAATDSGDTLEIDMDSGEIRNLTKGLSFKARAVPPFMQELIKAGGLMESIRKKGVV